jgi:uncharacterized protein (DUF1697 family)
MPVRIALLRAIGPATHVRMSMKDLRDACEAAGLDRVATYIQTGNVIFETRKSTATVQAIIEGVLRRFDLANPVVLRRPDDLAVVIAADPFPDAARIRPSRLCVCFMASPPSDDGLRNLAQYRGPERFKLVGQDLCIDYPEGVAGSKLSPAVVERRLGTPGTARNWNTVRKLLAMARELED